MKITEFVSLAELRTWHRRSDWQAAKMIAGTWLSIAAIFAGVALWTNPFTLLLGVALLGGRMLALAVIMHECGHGSFFESRRANEFVGQYLAALPVFADMHRYAKGHARHHRLAGTERDPDLGNYRAYPIERASFRRKLWRDLSGQTGWKLLRARARNTDSLFGSQTRESGLVGFGATVLILFLALSLVGKGWLALLWPAAFLTSYMLIARLRQVAEHAGVPDLFDLDPRKNTRTTLARWWERIFLAPNFVNYHLEHHLAPGVPCYRLRSFHHFLKNRGVYAETTFPVGYTAVLRSVLA
jgi:fatty acid desaturase